MPDPPSDFRFPKHHRLLRASEFENVFAARSFANNPWFALYGAVNEAGHARLGITVSRRVGNAVVRNRWRRLLREGFRLSQHTIPPLDYVCVVRASSPPAFPELLASLSEMTLQIERRIKQKRRRAESADP